MKIVALVASFAVVILAMSGRVPGVYSAVVVDDFNDNSLDETIWMQTTSGGFSTIAEANQRLEFTHSGDRTSLHSGFAGLFGRCKLSGDFDIEMSFDLIDWPPGSAGRISLVASPLFWMERISGDPEIYLANLGDGAVIENTSDMSGKLRLQREGSTVTASYHDGSDWVEVDSRTGAPTGDVTFNITSSFDSGVANPETIVVAADDAIINAGTLGCHRNGDVDCSTRVTHFDALDVVSAAAGAPLVVAGCPAIGTDLAQTASAGEFTGPTIFGDVNCDGTASVMDAVPILRHLADLPPGLPETCTPLGELIQFDS
jgi:hypothetical protein